MTYACEKCIHRHPLGGCLVPSNLGYVERCKHFEEPKQTQLMTNEEYIRNCSAEQLATLIYGISMYDILCDRIRNAMIMNPLCDDESAGVDEVKKWLKEKI